MFTPQFKITAKNPVDKIWQAVKMYHNPFYSEKAHCVALDTLLEVFSDQLSLAWETYELEHGASQEDLDELRGTEREQNWETNELLNRLDF